MAARGSRRAGARRSQPRRPAGAGRGDWLFGYQPVREALRAGRRELHELLLQRSQGARQARLDEIRGLAAERGLSVREVDELPIDEPAQRMALRAGPLPQEELEVLAGRAGEHGLLVALDQIEDPQNLGAIARVADGAGAHGLVLPARRSAPLSPAVSRASAGAIEWLPTATVGNLARSLEALREAGYWIAAAEGEAESDLFELPDRVLSGRLVVVLGSEGRGIRTGVRALIDHAIRIPMRGHVESLNVATAAAVILYEIGRRRRPPTATASEG